MELLTAGLTTFVVYKVGFKLELLWALLFLWLAIVVTFVDFDTQEIPDRFSLMALVLGVSHLIYQTLTWGFVWHTLAAAIITFVVLSLFMFLNTMGGGDVKFMTGTALLLGLKGVFIALYIGFILGGLVALVLVITKRVKRKSMIAFGPYLMIGSMISLLYGQSIWNLYINTMF